MIEFAYAADAAAAQPSPFQSFAPLVLIMFAAYFLLIRPMSKQKKKAEQMVSELTKNDEVLLASGIAGKITRLGEQFMTVEIAPNVEIHIQKHPGAIAQRLEKGSLKKIAKGDPLTPKVPETKKDEKKSDKKESDFDSKANAMSMDTVPANDETPVTQTEAVETTVEKDEKQ